MVNSSAITLLAIGGTLSAVAAIIIAEALFIPASYLVLTQGEWELLAIVLYVVAIFLYVGEGQTGARSRGARRSSSDDN